MLSRRQGLKAAFALAGAAALDARPGRAAPAATSPVVVSLSERRSRYLLDVSIEGRGGYQFVLDTGASAYFVSERVVEALALPRVAQRRVRGYDGRRATDLVAIARFAAGGVELGPVRAVAWSPERLEGHDGLIGYPFLFPQALVDLGRGELSLRTPPASPVTAVAAQVLTDQTLLVGGLAGAPGRFVFDTGAQDCIVSPAYFRRIASAQDYLDATKLIYRRADGTAETAAFRPHELAFGELRIPGPVVRVGRADGREGVFHQVDGLFGVSQIRRYAWALDQQARTLKATDAGLQAAGWHGSGLRLERDGAGGARVAAAAEDGPAFEAGVRPGQPVLGVGGHPPERWDEVERPRDRPSAQMLEVVDRGVRRRIAFETRVLI